MAEKTLSDQNISESQPKAAAEIDPIRGKVAKVISNREVALNIGKNQRCSGRYAFRHRSSRYF